jgi:molecular chaperone DnaJ
MQDPYRVLGVSPQATDDEVKQAYRALAKKYHPDVNNGSADAEARMKEVNEAYSMIMKWRREGTEGTGYNGAYGAGQGDGGGAGYASANPHMQAARNYIRAGHFQEAMHILEDIMERNAEWYYLCGEASLGLGNRVAALNYARQAVSMNPNNFEYRALLSRLEGGAQYYQTGSSGRGFSMPTVLCGSPLLGCCLLNVLCNCLCNCCGGGLGGGYYGRYR